MSSFKKMIEFCEIGIKRSMLLLMILLPVFAVTVEARTMSAKCSGFEGDTTQYFTSYPNKRQDLNKFETVKDRLWDGNLTLNWNESEKKAHVRYVFSSNNVPDDESDFQLVENDPLFAPGKITFVGYMQGGPTMISIYPELGIISRTQHSVWESSSLSGMGTSMFHAKCTVRFK